MKSKEGNARPVQIILMRALRILLGGLLVAGLFGVGFYLWALASTDVSLIARGILWGDSDAGDLHRFPARPMRANPDPVQFQPVAYSPLVGLPVFDEALGAVDVPLESYLEATNTTAFIVLHRESLQTSFSVAKSYTSTLVGIAIDEGFIGSLDDPVTDYLPELGDRDARFQEISLRHLITMTSGLRWERSESNPLSDDFVSYYSPDLRSAAMNVEIVQPPGREFVYNDYNPPLLGMVLERATGMSVSEYMETRLWQPMGAEGDGSWSLDSERAGFERMFVGLNGRPIDLVKLGWLFLHEGRNGDQQVVSSGWVREATAVDSVGDPADDYQYYWWIDPDLGSYYAEGDKCQFIYVYPKADLVLGRFGTDCGGTSFIFWMRELAQWLDSQL
jgi:CubicO group peptidase (beta-lactamase class C family)